MAIKDEYEVARLYTDGAFRRQLETEFGGWEKLEFHLAPPLLARRDKRTGHLRKQRFGPWMFRAFRVLAAARRARGRWFDIIGHTAERRWERRLWPRSEAARQDRGRALRGENHSAATVLAAYPFVASAASAM